MTDHAISTNVLTVRYDSQNEEKFEDRKRKLCQKIASDCEMNECEGFDINDNVLPYVLKQFYETSKEAFDVGSIQVFKKSKDNYSLVGVTGIFEEQASILVKLIRQYKSIRVADKELLEVLQFEQKLLRFPKVRIFVSNEHLILSGERNEIQECASFIQAFSKPESCTRVVSENIYKFLEMENVRPAINNCLLSEGYPICWKVTKEKTYSLICRSISYDPEKAADFLICQLVKEIIFPEEYLECSNIKEMANLKIFRPKQGFCALVCFGKVDLPHETMKHNGNFWFDRKVYMLEVLEILSSPDVQRCIEKKLILGKFQRWVIFKECLTVSIFCQSPAQADQIVSQILGQVCCVSKSAEMCQPSSFITQFCEKHSDVVQIKKGKDFWKFYIIADLKDEFENLFKVSSEGGSPNVESLGKSIQTLPKTTTLLFTEEILRYLANRCNEKLRKIEENFGIGISIKKTSLELKTKSEIEVSKAKENLLTLLKKISCQREKVRIRNDFNCTKLEEEIKNLEEAGLCTLTLSKTVEEPNYLNCWDAHYFHIVLAEGSLASVDSDLLICLLDENWLPPGSSGRQILMAGEIYVIFHVHNVLSSEFWF